jgi:hypothetical protein
MALGRDGAQETLGSKNDAGYCRREKECQSVEAGRRGDGEIHRMSFVVTPRI